MNFGAFGKACLSKFDESEDSRPHLDHLHVIFFPNAADEEEEKQRKEEQGRTNPGPKEAVSLLCVINSKKFFGMKAKVCSQTSCPVPSHCFTDCTCARESLKARASSNQLQNNRINYQFNQDFHNLSLKRGTISRGLLR